MTHTADTPSSAPLTERPVMAVVDRLDAMAQDGPVSLRDMVAGFGWSAFAPVMLLPALVVFSPLSGVPLLSTVCGVLIGMIAAQGAAGRDHIWLPDRLMRLSLSQARAQQVARSVTWAGNIVDRFTRPRLSFLLTDRVRGFLYLLCALFAFCFPLLEMVPFTSTLLGAGIALMAIAIMARDGLFVTVAITLMVIAGSIPITLIEVIRNTIQGRLIGNMVSS